MSVKDDAADHNHGLATIRQTDGETVNPAPLLQVETGTEEADNQTREHPATPAILVAPLENERTC